MGNIKFLNIIIIFILLVFVFGSTNTFAVDEITIPDKTVNKEKTIEKTDFEEVLRQAEEHSYDLKLADYNILISKQGIRRAKSEYFPHLNAGGGMEYTKNFRDENESTVMSIADAFINPYTRFQSVLGVTVSYNVFDFGVRGGNVKIAKEDAKLKELELKEKYQELNLTLLDTYTKILMTSKRRVL